MTTPEKRKTTYDRIELALPKGQKEVVQAHATAHSESVNGFIGRAINEAIERDSAVWKRNPSESPQQAAETAAGPGAVYLPSDTLEEAQRAAEIGGYTLPEYIGLAVHRAARRDSAGPSSMIVLNPETVRAASVGGFAVGESVREYVIRAVHELVERERPEWDEQTLRFEEAQRIASEKGIACLPPPALLTLF